jgi:uncharacterized membrane protein YhhN
MKTRALSLIYFFAGIIFIVLEFSQVFWPGVAVKALIMPLLISILWINSRQGNFGSSWLMLTALLFSWAGDIALEFTRQHEMMFLVGLLCFMMTQILYFVVFYRTPGISNGIRKLLIFIIPVYIYGAGLLFYLYDDLGDMRIPVIVYALVILTMLAGAVSRIGKAGRISFALVLCGAILFVLSDSMIAINKFSYPFSGARIAIMSTYIAGQYLIVTGAIRQHREEFN